MDPFVVLLAAGEGKRMKSDTPKVLHKICGLPMIEWEMRAVKNISARKPLVIVGHGADAVRDALSSKADFIEQTPRLGSGHALMCAKESIPRGGHVLVMAGDMPLLREETLRALCEKARGAAASVLFATVQDPTGYGRIVRGADGSVESIVEHRDASADQLAIREINASVYCFAAEHLLPALDALKNDNDQGEYYLTDVIALLSQSGKRVEALEASELECMGVNDRVQLSAVASIVRARIIERHMLEGVTVIDPRNTYIDADVAIGRDTVLYPGCVLEGDTRIGSNCTITQGSRIVDSSVGNFTTIQGSLLTSASVGDNAQIGPFVHLRPKAKIGSRCRLGNFVEIKNSNVADGAKVSHLSYVGDGDVGENVNIGCGVVFSNYDGVKKHRTVIEKNSFIGCNTNLIPPVTVGENSYIAAGSTITEDVPPGSLGIARARQVNKIGWKTSRDAVYKKE